MQGLIKVDESIWICYIVLMYMTLKETDYYQKYLLTHGYTLYEDFSDARNPYIRYIRKEDNMYYWVTFWNGYTFLESGYSDKSFTGRMEKLACSNAALHYRYKNVPDELLIVSACSSGSKMMQDLNAYYMDKILEKLG